MSLDFPLQVKDKKLLLFLFPSQQGGGGCVFGVFFAPIPEKGISDFIAPASIIQVFPVLKYRNWDTQNQCLT